MRLTDTLQIRPKLWAICISYVLLLTLTFSKSYSQTRVYANTATVKSAVVSDATFATDAATNNFATVRSYGGAGLGNWEI
jgi:hypothetical protein